MEHIICSISACVIGFTASFFAFAALHMANRKQPTRLQKLSVWIFAIWSVDTLKDLLLPIYGYEEEGLSTAIFFIDGWLLLTFTAFLREVCPPKPGKRRENRYLLPAHFAYIAIPFVVLSVAQAIFQKDWITTLYMWMLVVFGSITIVASLKRVRRYREFLKQHYSDITHRDITRITYSFIAGSFFYMLSWLIISLVNNPLFDILYYTTGIVLWLTVIRQSENLEPTEEIPLPEPITEPLGTKAYAFEEDLRKAMDEKELYLDPNLTLQLLAIAIGTNRTYLSRYLSEVKGTNFYDYINQQRIFQKSIPLLADENKYTLDYVALKSGFNSLSTFQRAFRKYKGITPGQFRDQSLGPCTSPTPKKTTL